MNVYNEQGCYGNNHTQIPMNQNFYNNKNINNQ